MIQEEGDVHSVQRGVSPKGPRQLAWGQTQPQLLLIEESKSRLVSLRHSRIV